MIQSTRRARGGARRLFRALAVAAGVATALPALGQDVYLVARQGTVTMPDGVKVVIWGFAQDADANLATVGSELPSLPGPVIRVPVGDPTLRIHLRNDLQEPVSIVINGQDEAVSVATPVWTDGTSSVARPGPAARVRSFTHEAAPNGGTAVYTWNNLKPGTYLYESGTHPAVQVQMGLYGAMVTDAGTGLAYAGKNYDQDAILLFSEIDPALHNAVATHNYGPGTAMTSTIDYAPKYWLVNGKPFPATSAVTMGPGTTLLRLLNAGLDNESAMLPDGQGEVIAVDGRPLGAGLERYFDAIPLPAGSTRDVRITVNCPADAGRGLLQGGRLRLSNNGHAPGGMMVNLYRCNPPVDSDSDGITDDQDNCLLKANANQVDTDYDGYGNACDGDFNNNGIVDLGDIYAFIPMIGTHNPNGDFNGNGIVDLADIYAFIPMIGRPVGPSALAP